MAKSKSKIFAFRLDVGLMARIRKHGLAPKQLIEAQFERIAKYYDDKKDQSPEIYDIDRKARVKSLKAKGAIR